MAAMLAGLCWAGHSNPRHIRNFCVPKFGRRHGLPQKSIENVDVREGDEARARMFAEKLNLTNAGIERVYCVTTSRASCIPSKIIFVDDLIAAKEQILDLPAEVLVVDTVGNDLAALTAFDEKRTLELANKVHTFLTEMAKKFTLVIVNASISCRTGGLRGCTRETFFRNSESYNHYLEAVIKSRVFDPLERIQFNPLTPYRFKQVEQASDRPAPKIPADDREMLKDSIHPWEEYYIQRVRGFIFDHLHWAKAGVPKPKKRRRLSRAEKSNNTRVRLGMK